MMRTEFADRGHVRPLMLNFFVPLLLKEEAKTVDGWREYFYWQIRNFGYQSAHVSEMGSLDMILLDLLANRAGKPLHRFLGADRDWCRVYKGGGSVLLSDEELIEDLVRFKSEGYHQTKFKIGYGTDWGKDIRRLEKALDALGEEFGIAVDANQAWDVETAFAFSKEAAAYHVSWFEEPIHAYDMAGLKQLRDKLDEAGIAMVRGHGRIGEKLSHLCRICGAWGGPSAAGKYQNVLYRRKHEGVGAGKRKRGYALIRRLHLPECGDGNPLRRRSHDRIPSADYGSPGTLFQRGFGGEGR